MLDSGHGEGRLRDRDTTTASNSERSGRQDRPENLLPHTACSSDVPRPIAMFTALAKCDPDGGGSVFLSPPLCCLAKVLTGLHWMDALAKGSHIYSPGRGKEVSGKESGRWFSVERIPRSPDSYERCTRLGWLRRRRRCRGGPTWQ